MTKDELIFSLNREYFIIKGIFSKIAPPQYAYRPTPKSRSIEELLKYLTVCGYGSLVRILKDEPEMKRLKEAAPFTDLAKFPEAIDAELARISGRIRKIADKGWDSGRSNYPWGPETSLQAAIIETCLKNVIAYRMNFFLWAKEAGNHELDRNVCWAHP
jgi:hypothetical protein